MWGRVFIFFRGTVFFISLRVAGCFFNEDGCRCRRCRLSFSVIFFLLCRLFGYLQTEFFWTVHFFWTVLENSASCRPSRELR